MNRIVKIYEFLFKRMTSRNWGILMGILFAVSLIPIIWVGFYNYASGDDYWYGIHTYRGLQQAGLWGALKGSLQTVAEFYQSWQGTWFTLFLFTLSPNNFIEGSYVITVFLALGCLIGSIAYLGHYYLVRRLNFTRGATAGIVCMVLYLAIQYMPRTTSGLYWFNGVMHYSIPFLLATIAIVHSHKFVEGKKKRDYGIAFLCLTLLGGGSYLAPVVALLAVCLLLLCQLKICRKDTKSEKNGSSKELSVRIRGVVLCCDVRNLWLLVALGAELIGLYISFAAPGNSVRGGEEFSADLKWAISCVFQAIDRGIYLGEDYFLLNPVTTVCYLLLAVLLWSQMWRAEQKEYGFRLPLLFVIYLNGIYWASYTPEIYARSDVSGGVPNTYFHLFLLVTLANMVYVHGWVQRQMMRYWKKKASKTGNTYEEIRDGSLWYGKKYKKYIMLPAAVAGSCALIIAGNLMMLPRTNEYCMEYLGSGKAQRYAFIRQEQHRILSETEEAVVTVPETYEDQYPMVHMGLGENSNASRNRDRARYYGKESVTAAVVE